MILTDEDCPESIRKFVRENSDIEVYDYIQRGCNGEVYFGTRKKLNDEVVLKFYLSQPNYDSSEEAVILRNIKHDNILQIFDLRFIPPSYALFLTPKITGGDLQGYIDNNSIPSKEALEIIAGILSGITELHSNHRIVHRDLKPGNILIDKETKKPIIADLGAVKKINEATGHVTASKSTRVYLPPESIVDNKYYYQSDLYQIGLIMFQLLKGHFPINNPVLWLNRSQTKEIALISNSIKRELKLLEMIDEMICKGKIADTSSIPFYLDLTYKKVINKAVNSDYSKRYSTSSHFLKDIHNLLRTTPDYFQTEDYLLIRHQGGKEYRLYKGKNDEYALEKRNSGKDWRKDNSHNGSIKSILDRARVA